jgi:hypothetical protein
VSSAVSPSQTEIELSVVVRIVGGERFLRRCLGRLAAQLDSNRVEVIVPYDSTVDGLERLKIEFPQVEFVDMGRAEVRRAPGTPAAAHELTERRVAKGFSVARGSILALVEDYGAPAPDWCTELLTAHRLPHGVIGGAVEHGGKGALNWAVYFKDSGRYQSPLPEKRVHYLTDANVSYKRPVLESVRPLWEERYNEATVHWALARRGVTLWQRPQIVVWQDRGQLSMREVAFERIAWGWLFGCVRAREMSLSSRVFYVLGSPAIPLVLIWRMAWKVFRGRRNRIHFLRSIPWIVLLTWLWCLGELGGYVSGREP